MEGHLYENVISFFIYFSLWESNNSFAVLNHIEDTYVPVCNFIEVVIYQSDICDFLFTKTIVTL